MAKSRYDKNGNSVKIGTLGNKHDGDAVTVLVAKAMMDRMAEDKSTPTPPRKKYAPNTTKSVKIGKLGNENDGMAVTANAAKEIFNIISDEAGRE